MCLGRIRPPPESLGVLLVCLVLFRLFLLVCYVFSLTATSPCDSQKEPLDEVLLLKLARDYIRLRKFQKLLLQLLSRQPLVVAVQVYFLFLGS